VKKVSILLGAVVLKARPSALADALQRILRIPRLECECPPGVKWMVDPASHFGRQLLRGEGYEPQMERLIRGLLRPGDTFVDIGANEGYFSVLAARRVGQGKVYAAEPQGRLGPVIRKNAELNGCGNVVLWPVAVADRNDTAELFLHPSTNTGSSGLLQPARWHARRETVPTRTLDGLFAEHHLQKVRMMKVDCEGGEKLVLAGGREVLKERRIEILAWEYHPTVLSPEEIGGMDSYLKGCGYRFLEVGGQTLYCLPGLEKEIERAAQAG
jgi:FkbM family methyltransferase